MLRQLFTLVPWPPATWKYLIVLLVIDVVIGVDLWRMRPIRLLQRV